MIENDAELAADPTGWTAPFVATLAGLPLLVGECIIFGIDSYVSSLDVMVYGGLRRSARMLLMGTAMASG
ncbi:hypothetical protein QQM39_21900 [Streptomyces sp. DT2A-34]|uniref:hypothetical protein n=1 Tax=Streptomyces sp. DT2A-34 TaxID=3051182 RepID=UPI00265BBB0D|nr:hypothetical protein [Streptomyces sp. DT2A-34]MDO0913401.1 hypothetical protein [Streptomyces sp. DT2A-34]